MEFMLLSAFLLFIFIFALGLITANSSYTSQKKIDLTAEDIVTKVQKEINLAARVLDGYYREFYIPQKLVNKDYEIYIRRSATRSEVVLHVDNKDFWSVVPSVEGELNKGSNKVNKTNDIIYLNQN